MNETTKKLMMAVERAVRPVQATSARKMRMRKELLAHLTAAFEDARGRLNDEPAAVGEALQRFGPPEDLTNELQASCGWREQAAVRLQRLILGPAGAAAARQALGVAVLFLILGAISALLVATPIAAAEGLDADVLTRLRIAGSFLLIGAVDGFCLVWMLIRLREALVSGEARVRTAVAAAVLAILLVFASNAAFALLGCGQFAVALALLPLALTGGVTAALMLLMTAASLAADRRRSLAWADLEIA